jgi:hypothetical protein
MLDHEQEPFRVGDIVLMNTKCWGYDDWSKLCGVGPFVITKVDLENTSHGSKIKRLSDGKEFNTGVPRPWWLVLDTFLNAAHKANHEKV